MNNFITDMKNFYFFKNNNFLKFKENGDLGLTINNIYFIEDNKIERFLNNIRLIEK
jgi:hypothetical protein